VEKLKKLIFGILLVMILCSTLVFSGFVEARGKSKTWVVNLNGTGDFTAIQAALNSVNSGDTILVMNGVYYEHLGISKTVTLNGENRLLTIIDGGGAAPASTIVIEANNVVINGFTIQNAMSGGRAIWEDGYTGAIISNNIITNNGDGIRILNSHGNKISNNVLKNNPYTALGFDASYSNTISGNTISNNYIGVGAGIPSYSNVFSGNIVTQNSYGFLLAMYNSKFFHNNVIGNNIQAAFYDVYVNTWNNGYPSGGNYWSNYVGVDNYRGAAQNKIGHDGIGDTPYVIDAQNKDNYPLMTPLKLP
jgi:parallel beta-helix repeat protein